MSARKICLAISFKDLAAEGDSFVATVSVPDIENKWKEVDRTEVVKGGYNQSFTKAFSFDFDPSTKQMIRFSIYDVSRDHSALTDNNHVGSVKCALSEIADSRTQSITRPIM
eukprot:GEZU01015009.1.p1 GENE.GEZU01015009.1~~GEZU01015009.1.p1  ORF type:complete len:112 (+),score=9.31 GEZU01015009.1:75-410(+)